MCQEQIRELYEAGYGPAEIDEGQAEFEAFRDWFVSAPAVNATITAWIERGGSQ